VDTPAAGGVDVARGDGMVRRPAGSSAGAAAAPGTRADGRLVVCGAAAGPAWVGISGRLRLAVQDREDDLLHDAVGTPTGRLAHRDLDRQRGARGGDEELAGGDIVRRGADPLIAEPGELPRHQHEVDRAAD